MLLLGGLPDELVDGVRWELVWRDETGERSCLLVPGLFWVQRSRYEAATYAMAVPINAAGDGLAQGARMAGAGLGLGSVIGIAAGIGVVYASAEANTCD